ncbi:MAG TPA: glycosyltransferase [Pyrinomonadaceae bacterium]|nr:glycosyltransferase [Pyrinomonadaceae bacterium]
MEHTALKGRRALFISYNGMLDPLGQSQVIPYLRELSRAEGLCFTLLSFERAPAFEPAGVAACESLREQLADAGIEWHWLRYHQTPSLPATAYDVFAGSRLARELVRRNRIEVVHARSHVPATVALSLKKRFGLKMIFDVRGLMAEEYADAGHWREGSFRYRLTKRMERRCFAAADGVVTLTESIWPIIKEWDGLRGREVAHEVIPCCADLERFRFVAEERAARRKELGFGDAVVLVYSGSIGGWYLNGEMANFFTAVLRAGANVHFLLLTPNGHDRVHAMMRERGIGAERYTVRASAPRDVASYLSAADAGVAFIKPCFSKLASSPTKTAEYLACGLPVVINAGVGDSDLLITEEKVGALIDDFNEDEYRRAGAEVFGMLRDVEGVRAHTRRVAERLFDVRGVGLERYARLYETVCRS